MLDPKSPLAVAFNQTAAGRKLFVEAKARETEKDLAVMQAKLIFDARRTEVLDLVRVAFPGRPDIIYHARKVPQTAGVIKEGGEAYQHLVTRLRFARVGLTTAEKNDNMVRAYEALGLVKAKPIAKQPLQLLSISESNELLD
jgi:hypothetical protein